MNTLSIINSTIDHKSHYYVYDESKSTQVTIQGKLKASKYKRINVPLTDEIINSLLEGQQIIAVPTSSQGKTKQIIFDHDQSYNLTRVLERIANLDITVVPSKTIGRAHIHLKVPEQSLHAAYWLAKRICIERKLCVDVKPMDPANTDEDFQIITLPFYDYINHKDWYNLFINYTSIQELIQRIRGYGYDDRKRYLHDTVTNVMHEIF